MQGDLIPREGNHPGAEHPLLNKSNVILSLMSVLFGGGVDQRAEAQDGKECSRCTDGRRGRVSGQR